MLMFDDPRVRDTSFSVIDNRIALEILDIEYFVFKP